MALRLRRGVELERTFKPDQGELIFVTDTNKVYVGDGNTVGGILVGPTTLSDELSPQLGGDLDLNEFNIVGIGNINITGNITATGSISLGDNASDNISVVGLINSSLTPAIDDSYNLGTSAKQWANVWSTQVNVDTTLAVGSQIIKLSGGTADSSLILWDAETDTVTASQFIGNVVGSVYGDDEFVVLDTVNSLLRVDSIETTTIDSVDNSLIINSTNDEAIDINCTLNDGVASFVLNRAKGTPEAPLDTVAGDFLGGLKVKGRVDGEFKYASGLVTQWASDANFTKEFPSSNLLFIVNNNTDTQEVIPAYLSSDGTFVAQAIQTGVYTDTPDTKPAGAKGLIIFNDTTGTFQGYNGTAWVDLSS